MHAALTSCTRRPCGAMRRLERGAPHSAGGAAGDRLAGLAQSRAPVPGGVARVPAGTGDAGASGEPDAPWVRAPPLRLFSIADHVVRTGGASVLRCGARRSRLVGPSGTATRRPQEEGPAQAAHAAEGDEEVVALSKFMCARHACGAVGGRPPVQRAQRATARAFYSCTGIMRSSWREVFLAGFGV